MSCSVNTVDFFALNNVPLDSYCCRLFNIDFYWDQSVGGFIVNSDYEDFCVSRNDDASYNSLSCPATKYNKVRCGVNVDAIVSENGKNV